MTFNINKNVGTPKKAETLKGKNITRQESLFVEEYGALIPCAPYDDHFVYENPDKSAGSPAYMCTCGAIAVIPSVNPRMFVCLFHAQHGQHQTSLVNKDTFKEKFAGETLEIKPAKRWI